MYTNKHPNTFSFLTPLSTGSPTSGLFFVENVVKQHKKELVFLCIFRYTLNDSKVYDGGDSLRGGGAYVCKC